MILQRHLPYDPAERPRLPGIQPLSEPWIVTDDAFAEQMAERARLIETDRDAVLAERPGARPAVLEALEAIVAALPDGYKVAADHVVRPDDNAVALDRDDPLATLGRLVQEDVCVLERGEDAAEHVLTAAMLCFPARWRLSEKIGHPLTTIHDPVPDYDGNIARRVQRLFDGIGVGRPLWRCNELWTADPTLYQPDPPATRPKWSREAPDYLRTERQCLVRLPQTRAVVFTIHTYMLERADVPGVRERPEEAPAGTLRPD
ncbi:hypothetical protein ROJ8625_01361 [Roseivivax jejudonensis]|uniref:DUF3445 domain-containing protein n=1 Tax=Roseivivax jejudonensis TaxID=1529041 RepID=A0A1X6YSU7_9RHOB|nr:DUF3445 domain-containing protein [Roseivivax jejudonensis]SLN30280.1 hypothetical protein ROJ8625_01361 [Roseivivax jejudonensis]